MLAFHLLMLLHGPSVIHPRGVVHFPFSHGLSAICPRGIVRFRMLTPVTDCELKQDYVDLYRL